MNNKKIAWWLGALLFVAIIIILVSVGTIQLPKKTPDEIKAKDFNFSNIALSNLSREGFGTSCFEISHDENITNYECQFYPIRNDILNYPSDEIYRFHCSGKNTCELIGHYTLNYSYINKTDELV